MQFIRHRFRGNVLNQTSGKLEVKNLSFTYPDGKTVYNDIFFTAEPGEIIGVTGPVACGKSTFGKTFLCECPYKGSIKYNGNELSSAKKSSYFKCVINRKVYIFEYIFPYAVTIDGILRITCFLVMIAMYQNTSRTYVSIKKLHRWKMELTHLLVMVV